MRVVQIREPGAPFELVERPLPEPGPGKVRIKVEACGICHSDFLRGDRALSRHSVSARCPGTRSPAISMRSGAGVTDGAWGSASASAGMAAIAGCAPMPARATSSPARQRPGARHRLRRRLCRVHDRAHRGARRHPRRAQCRGRGAAALRRHHHLQCAAQQRARARAISWPCSASAGSGISPCSSRRRWAFAPSPSRAARTRRRWRSSSAPTATSTARRRTRPKVLTELGGAKVILATATSAKAMTPLIDGLGIDGKLLVRRGFARADRGHAAAAHRRPPVGGGLAIGARRRFRGHHALQRAHRRQADDRDLSARARR